MTAQLRPVEEVANAAISAVGWTDTETATKHAINILTTDRDTAYTLLREGIIDRQYIVNNDGQREMTDLMTADILILLDHIYGKTDAHGGK